MAKIPTGNQLLEELKEIAPSIALSVTWIEDPHFVWDGDGPDPREEGYVPHDVDVTARAIVKGMTVDGENHLGGAYDKPDERDPDIHGYLPQMLDEALDDLVPQIRKYRKPALIAEIKAAQKHLEEVMKARYDRDTKRAKRRA